MVHRHLFFVGFLSFGEYLVGTPSSVVQLKNFNVHQFMLVLCVSLPFILVSFPVLGYVFPGALGTDP